MPTPGIKTHCRWFNKSESLLLESLRKCTPHASCTPCILHVLHNAGVERSENCWVAVTSVTAAARSRQHSCAVASARRLATLHQKLSCCVGHIRKINMLLENKSRKTFSYSCIYITVFRKVKAIHLKFWWSTISICRRFHSVKPIRCHSQKSLRFLRMLFPFVLCLFAVKGWYIFPFDYLKSQFPPPSNNIAVVSLQVSQSHDPVRHVLNVRSVGNVAEEHRADWWVMAPHCQSSAHFGQILFLCVSETPGEASIYLLLGSETRTPAVHFGI